MNRKSRCSAIVNDNSIFIKAWHVKDERIGAVTRVGVLFTVVSDLACHSRAAMMSGIYHLKALWWLMRGSLFGSDLQALYMTQTLMATAQRLALQLPPRRAARESVKMATISRAEGGQLQARVSPPRLATESAFLRFFRQSCARGCPLYARAAVG